MTRLFTKQKICLSHGFTLIELLVVVLIIAILAAIALPQYRIAVEKSRAADALLNLRAAATAMEVYKLTHGSYPGTFKELDVGFGANCTGAKCMHGQFEYNFRTDLTGIVAYLGTMVSSGELEDRTPYLAYVYDDGGAWNAKLKKGDFVCNARDGRWRRVCLALGGSDSNTFSYAGTVYILPR